MIVISIIYHSIIFNVHLTVIVKVTTLLGYLKLELYSKLSAK